MEVANEAAAFQHSSALSWKIVRILTKNLSKQPFCPSNRFRWSITVALGTEPLQGLALDFLSPISYGSEISHGSSGTLRGHLNGYLRQREAWTTKAIFTWSLKSKYLTVGSSKTTNSWLFLLQLVHPQSQGRGDCTFKYEWILFSGIWIFTTFCIVNYHMGFTLRFPRAMGIRDDLSVEDCMTRNGACFHSLSIPGVH